MPKYTIEIDVNGADSGSERLADMQGQPVDKEKKEGKKRKAPSKKISALSKIEDLIGKEKFKQIRNITGGVTAVAVAGLSIYEQNAGFKGDSNTVVHLNETMKWVGRIAAVGGLIATGRFAGAGLLVGYTAFALAKENRELINTRSVDSYQSRYYQQRLVYDVSKRSR